MGKYLITGITGFAGPHLAKLLIKEGHNVHGLVRATSGRETDLLDIFNQREFEQITFQYSDLLNIVKLMKIIEVEQYDGVYHLAAQSHPGHSFKDPINTFQDNVIGTVHLVECITRYSPETKFMLCSTSEVYGDQCKDIGMLKEDTPLKPCNPYGASKASIDLYVQERMKNGFLKGFITRAFSHTGPRRFKNFSISSDAYQIVQMVKGLKTTPLWIGNLETERVVIDVRDTVRAYYLLMEHCHDRIINTSNGQVYNVCGTEVRKMRYFTEKLIEISGLKNVEMVKYVPFYRTIDIQVQIGDSSKLKELTLWKPEIPIEQTLKDLYDYWYKKM